MNVSIPDSLSSYIIARVHSGGYASAEAFIVDLVQSEASVMAGVARGEALDIGPHFDRRLEALLDEAALSGDYVDVSSQDFDQLEREALQAAAHRKLSL